MASENKIQEYLNILEQDKIMIETHFANMEKILRNEPKLDQQRAFGLLNNYNTLSIQYDQLCSDLINFIKIFKSKDDVAQYRIAQTINKTPDAKVLTYDVMDSGFFTAAGVLPQNRFFCYLNIEHGYSAVLEEQTAGQQLLHCRQHQFFTAGAVTELHIQ